MKTTSFRHTALRHLALFLLLIGFVPAASAQAHADINGYWRFMVDRGDGTVRQTFFEFHQDGEQVTGRILSRNPAGDPVEGTFKDNVLHFEGVPRPGRPRSAVPDPRRAIYDGHYANGKLSLQTMNHRGHLLAGVAEKTTKEATLPPAALPLPELRPLPDNGLARTPPMGWNSWNKFAGDIDDAAVRGIADALVSSGMAKAGYVYVNIDDTWEGNRDLSGNITSNTRFPNMEALADYIHSKGLKIGIYSAPGPQTCGEYGGSFGHELQDAKTYASWGIDYLKYDLCSGTNVYADTRPNVQGLYQKMGEALKATGRPIVYSLCEYGHHDVWTWGADVGGNLWRTTVDINDSWGSMDKIGFSQLKIASFAKPGHWNDPDMLEIGNGGMNGDEYRTHMSLWSLLSAPLIAGNDLRNMSAETKSILLNRDVIAIDQDAAAKPVQTLSLESSIEVLWRPLQDGTIAVGIFNRGDKAAEAGFAWSSLHNAAGVEAGHAVDLWKHEAVAVAGDRFSAPIPAHGVVLLRVSATK